MPTLPPCYSLLVFNVGWVITNDLDYEYVLGKFYEYKYSGDYDQVTMWSSEEEDPIEEFSLKEPEDILPMAPDD